MLIEKYNAGEQTEYDLLSMYPHEYKKLPFGTWVVDRADVVPILKEIKKRLTMEARIEESRMNEKKELIRKEINERKHDDFSENSLGYRLSFDFILPELTLILNKYAWLLRLAEGQTSASTLKLEDIKQIPIATVLGERGGVKGKHVRHFFNCPLHTENTPSFCWYTKNNSWYCFGGCGVGGDVIDLYQKMNKCDFMTAVKALQQLI